MTLTYIPIWNLTSNPNLTVTLTCRLRHWVTTRSHCWQVLLAGAAGMAGTAGRYYWGGGCLIGIPGRYCWQVLQAGVAGRYRRLVLMAGIDLNLHPWGTNHDPHLDYYLEPNHDPDCSLSLTLTQQTSPDLAWRYC